MGKYKVTKEDYKELAKFYNDNGKHAFYEELGTRFNVKKPYYVLKRMYSDPELSYDEEKDCFCIMAETNAEDIFMSMDELCSPLVPQRSETKVPIKTESRPAAMEKLIRELIGDRLLELSRYVTIDSLSKKIIVDKTTLTEDGYQLITH